MKAASLGMSLLAVSAALSGCGGGSASATPAPTTPSAPNTNYQPKGVDAGVKVERADVKQINGAIMATVMKVGRSRPDPFALTDVEKQYDANQTTERVLASSGGWRFDYVEPEDKEATVVYEPQPARRLMGVIVGDAVYGVIDMGDGVGRIIYPGLKIEGTEWYVVSIDEDKAILRRDSLNLPKEVVVKLQSASALGGAPNNGGPFNGVPGPGNRRGGKNSAPGGDDLGL